MPYASAPTAPEEHYNSDRLLAWQREKKVRADAARRRKARQHAAAARAKGERERGENDLAARRVKKLEYVTYLREQFSARKEKSARKARRAPESQWDVDERRAAASRARAVAARKREAERRDDEARRRADEAASRAAVAPAVAAAAPPPPLREPRSLREPAPPAAAPPPIPEAHCWSERCESVFDDRFRSSCGDLAAPGFEGTPATTWSAVADAAAARLRARIEHGKREQMTTKQRMEAWQAEIASSPDSRSLLEGPATSAAPPDATPGAWARTLDHAPSALYASLDLAQAPAVRRDRPGARPAPLNARPVALAGYGYGARHAAQLAGPSTGCSRTTQATLASGPSTRRPPGPGPRWGAGAKQDGKARERELLRKRKAEYAERQRLQHRSELRRRRAGGASAAPSAASDRPPRLEACPPAPMPCERSPPLPGRRPVPCARSPQLPGRQKAPKSKLRDVNASVVSVEVRDVEKSLRRLDGLLKAKQRPRKSPPTPPEASQQPYEQPGRRRSPPTPPSDGSRSAASTPSDGSDEPRRRHRREDLSSQPRRRRDDVPPRSRRADAIPEELELDDGFLDEDARFESTRAAPPRHAPPRFGYRPPAHAPPGDSRVVQTSLAYLLTT